MIKSDPVKEAMRTLVDAAKGHGNDPLDWLMGDDFAQIQIKAKLGVAQQSFILNRSLGRGGSIFVNTSNDRPISARLSSVKQQALVKIIKDGGAKTSGGLKAQLKYLEKEGEAEIVRSERYFEAPLEEKDHESLVDSWGLNEQNTTGVDKTSHFVVSFPPGTDRDAAGRAGRAWAAELFNSGDYGDVWDYYTVTHNDTAHPHVHVVVNRRGIEDQEWLKVSKRSLIDYNVLREVQVQTAALEGIELEATPRHARGLTDRPHTIVEVKRADREGRDPLAPPHTLKTASNAAVKVLGYAQQIAGEAEIVRGQYPEIAKSLQNISDSLKSGVQARDVILFEKELTQKELEGMSELLLRNHEKLDNSFKELDAQIASLKAGSAARIEFEREASDNRAKAGAYLPKYRNEKLIAEKEGQYKGVQARGEVGNEIKEAANQEVAKVAKSVGLDANKTLARYNSSRAVNANVANRWKEEERSEASAKGHSPKEIEAAQQKIDTIYADARTSVYAHEETKKEIFREAQKSLDNQNSAIANTQLSVNQLRVRAQKIRDSISDKQREGLEKGDHSQLKDITTSENVQRVIAKDYLDSAVETSSVQQRSQLEKARQLVVRNIDSAQQAQQRQQLQKQQQELQNRQNNERGGIER